MLLCSGYSTGEVYVYNLTCLLLLCIIGYRNHDNDGMLFIGYQHGFFTDFTINCDTGMNIFSKKCHYGAVKNLV